MVEANTLSRALVLLREAGVRVSGGNLDLLSLTLPNSTVREVRVYTGPSTKSRIEELAPQDHPTLVVTDKAGQPARSAAVAGHIDLIAIEPALVIIDGRELLRAEPVKAVSTSRRGAWGRLATLRALILSREPMRQQDLADAAGISQPAVNKHLKALGPKVQRRGNGWMAADPVALTREWLEQYPASGGGNSYWYSLRSPMEQAEQAAAYAREMGDDPLISGGAAADLYAPWALPSKFRIYLKTIVDFTDAGFVLAPPEEATMTATITLDRALWNRIPESVSGRAEAGLPLADPLITMADLLLEDTPDSADAARVLGDWMLTEGRAWRV